MIDKDGVIRYEELRGDPLDRVIEELMAEMDIEIDLSDVDHEAKQKAKRDAHSQTFRPLS